MGVDCQYPQDTEDGCCPQGISGCNVASSNLLEATLQLAGSHIAPTDTLPLQLEGELIEMIQDFAYLRSCTSRDGEIKKEVTCCIGKTARVVGCLQEPIFQNHRLSVEMKRKVYREVVLSVLLYEAETWTTKVESVKCLCGFHNRCFRTIIGVYKYQQWKECISSRRLASAGDNGPTLVEATSTVDWSCCSYEEFSNA